MPSFDFNGTLSDDEPVLARVYGELFAELGRPLSEPEYYEQLAGHTDEEMFTRWFGHADPTLIAERIARYNRLAADGSTVHEEVREAVRYAAERVPVAIVSAAARSEIDAGRRGGRPRATLLTLIVSPTTSTNGKPHPEGYLTAARVARRRSRHDARVRGHRRGRRGREGSRRTRRRPHAHARRRAHVARPTSWSSASTCRCWSVLLCS